MRNRFALCVVATCLVATFLVGGDRLWAQEADTVSADETAIRSAVDSYTAAFNSGDADGVAAHWSEGGELVTPLGETIQGRDKIKASFAKFFAENKGVRIEILEAGVRFLSPGVAVEEGTSRTIRSGEEPTETDYTVVHVKQNGKWKIDSVSEVDRVEQTSHYEQLKDLEWLIGEWADQSEDATIETVCEWTKNRNFISRSFRVVNANGGELAGTQVIGWDPSRNTIRSWMFDSEGGFGVGTWSKKGDQWTVSVLQVLKDGASASAINVLTYVDENTFTFKSTGRQIDGQLQPNIPEVTIARK